MLRSITACVAVGLLLAVLAVGASAQDRARRGPVQEPVESPAVPPTAGGPHPDHDLIVAYHSKLTGLSDEARREASLARARRLAPFDLDWGTR
jgi:hypothetical protein